MSLIEKLKNRNTPLEITIDEDIQRALDEKHCANKICNIDLFDPALKSVPTEMFWIYYPDAREVLKDSYVFSDRNSVVRKSFDAEFKKSNIGTLKIFSVRFVPYISLGSNVYIP